MKKSYNCLCCDCFGRKHKNDQEDPIQNDPAGLIAAVLANKRYVRRISRINSDNSLVDEKCKYELSLDKIEVAPPGSKLPFQLLSKGKKKDKKGTSSTESLIDDEGNTKENTVRNTLFKIQKILSVSPANGVEKCENEASGNKFKMVVMETMQAHKNKKETSSDCSVSLPERCDYQKDHRHFDFYQSSPLNYQTDEENDRGVADGSSDHLIANDDPTRECFGSVTFGVRSISTRAIGVRIISLQGLPCTKGRERGLCIEVTTTSGAQCVWLPIQNAKGPKIIINNEVTVKLSHKSKRTPMEHTIRITLWPAGHMWKYSAIGSIIYPCLPLTSEEITKIGLYQHTKTHLDLGLLELIITCVSEAPAITGKPNRVKLCVDIVRARLSQDLDVRKGQYVSKLLKGTKRDIWCKISIWKKGQRVEGCTTSKSRIPVTNDPVFKTSSSFSLLRSSLPFTALVIKLMIDKGLGDAVYGKVILGPHLYLGHPKENVAPGTLSHWGRALTHLGPVRAWHSLYL